MDGKNKPSFGIMFFGGVEILTLCMVINTLTNIDYYPIIMLFFPFPVFILGIFTIRLKPLARRLNLSLSPLVVFTYTFGLVMLLEFFIWITKINFRFKQEYFYFFFAIFLPIHILFFVNKNIKDQFCH